MGTSLLDRIKAAEQQQSIRQLRPSEPVPFTPVWQRRQTFTEADRFLATQDTTDLVLGAWIGPKDWGAA